MNRISDLHQSENSKVWFERYFRFKSQVYPINFEKKKTWALNVRSIQICNPDFLLWVLWRKVNKGIKILILLRSDNNEVYLRFYTNPFKRFYRNHYSIAYWIWTNKMAFSTAVHIFLFKNENKNFVQVFFKVVRYTIF